MQSHGQLQSTAVGLCYNIRVFAHIVLCYLPERLQFALQSQLQVELFRFGDFSKWHRCTPPTGIQFATAVECVKGQSGSSALKAMLVFLGHRQTCTWKPAESDSHSWLVQLFMPLGSAEQQ